MTDLAPWDRRPGEGAKPYEAFAAYRDMGPTRSHAKVAQQLGKDKTLIARWSRQYAWVMRAEAWDREDDRLFALEQRQARKDIARRHQRLAQAAQSKIVARLQSLDLTKMSAADLIRWLEVSTRVERESLGIAHDQYAAAANRGDSTALAHVPVLTDEDRQARLIALRREVDQRLSARRDEIEAAERASA